jgi:hypothetical protein
MDAVQKGPLMTTPPDNNEAMEPVDAEILAQPFEWRAEQILSRAFGGMHHVHGLKKEPRQWIVNHYGHLSTFDYNALTLLVLGAHHYCCRLSIQNSGPGMVKLILWPRFTRDRKEWDKAHPTIEEAIARYNERPSNQTARQMADSLTRPTVKPEQK